MRMPENIKIKKKIAPRPIDDVGLNSYDYIPIVGIKGTCTLCKKGQTTFFNSKTFI